MAHEVCNTINEWIEENVAQPVERWIDQLEQTFSSNPAIGGVYAATSGSAG